MIGVEQALTLLGEYVEALGHTGAVWRGRLIGIAEDPSVIIDEPDGSRRVVGLAALDSLVQIPPARKTAVCRCGHQAHWHGNSGTGPCDECDCSAFCGASARRYVAVLQAREGYPDRHAPMVEQMGSPRPPEIVSVVKADDYEALEAEVERLRAGIVDVAGESFDSSRRALAIKVLEA